MRCTYHSAMTHLNDFICWRNGKMLHSSAVYFLYIACICHAKMLLIAQNISVTLIDPLSRSNSKNLVMWCKTQTQQRWADITHVMKIHRGSRGRVRTFYFSENVHNSHNGVKMSRDVVINQVAYWMQAILATYSPAQIFFPKKCSIAWLVLYKVGLNQHCQYRDISHSNLYLPFMYGELLKTDPGVIMKNLTL